MSLVVVCALISGCSSHSAPTPIATQPSSEISNGLAAPIACERLAAWIDPPSGWIARPVEADFQHVHQFWVSPSGRTAYGVILMKLPLPTGPDWTLWAFLQRMRQTEGRADLIEKRKDAALPGYRFVADGSRYRIRVNFIVRDWRAWAIYAGTLRSETIADAELELAEAARENTRVIPP